MPHDDEIRAAAEILKANGCDVDHAMELARQVLLAAENVNDEASHDLFGVVVVVDDWPPNYKEQFWAAYPNKIGKADALKALDTLHGLSAKKKPKWQQIMVGLHKYVETKPTDRSWCNPGTFLRQHRWLDEPAAPVHNGARRGNGFAAIAAMQD